MALPRAASSGGSLPSGRTFCISLAQVKKCTENFSRKRIIAEGGESIVYKGAATDGSGKTWAVKHLNPNLDARYFFREVFPTSCPSFSYLSRHDCCVHLYLTA